MKALQLDEMLGKLTRLYCTNHPKLMKMVLKDTTDRDDKCLLSGYFAALSTTLKRKWYCKIL